MPSYKLTYFNTMGRAEALRLIFAQAGVEYEDKRVTAEEWTQLKPSIPTGQLPILEVDGTTLHGSRPICRFLGERFGLGGSNDLENAEIAGVGDYLNDFFMKLYPFYFEKDEEKRAELKRDIEEKLIPTFMDCLEKRVNSSPGDFMFGEKLTYLDLGFYAGLDLLKLFPTILEGRPGLTRVKEAVGSLPNIARWVKERPQTDR